MTEHSKISLALTMLGESCRVLAVDAKVLPSLRFVHVYVVVRLSPSSSAAVYSHVSNVLEVRLPL